MTRTIIISGGGIAGISCLESLIQEFRLKQCLFNRIILISEARLIKNVSNLVIRGRHLESFDVTETDFSEINDLHIPDGLSVDFVCGSIKHIDATKRTVYVAADEPSSSTQNHLEYDYDILSICTGARPNKLNVHGASDPAIQPFIFTIRDTTSIENLETALGSCRRVAIIGNGGISLGLVDKISNCDKVWLIRENFIGCPFLDSEASKFFLSMLEQGDKDATLDQSQSYWTSSVRSDLLIGRKDGPSLGPSWLHKRELKGATNSRTSSEIVYNCEIEAIEHLVDSDWPISIHLTTGRCIECDIIVSAIGVVPNDLLFLHVAIEVSDNDGGIVIDEQMRTSISNIYAAGDVVSCDRWPDNPLWFQMRLWSQARQMGHYCGKCIVAHLIGADPSIHFPFDCFTHSTIFFGKKVVLLGRYNFQEMDNHATNELEIIVRIRPGHEYTKLILKAGVVIGAVLVGDSRLDETIENLIYDSIDVSQVKDQLLDDSIDIEDYFD